jgi:hypothetical protein
MGDPESVRSDSLIMGYPYNKAKYIFLAYQRGEDSDPNESGSEWLWKRNEE